MVLFLDDTNASLILPYVQVSRNPYLYFWVPFCLFVEREELLETVFYLSRDLLFHVGLRSLARIFMADFFLGNSVGVRKGS